MEDQGPALALGRRAGAAFLKGTIATAAAPAVFAVDGADDAISIAFGHACGAIR
jgi:hypothetical protein